MAKCICMVTLIVDTHRLVSDLEEKYGYSKMQAEGFKHALDEINLDHLVTKADLLALQSNLFKWLAPVLVGQILAFAAVVGWFLQ